MRAAHGDSISNGTTATRLHGGDRARPRPVRRGPIRVATWLAIAGFLALLVVPLAGPRAALAQDTDEAPIVPTDPTASLPPDTASTYDPNAPAGVVLDDPAAVAQTDPAAVPTEPVAPVETAPVESLPAPPAPVVSEPMVDPNWAPPRTVYIPETGHTIDGLFLDLWRGSGGAGAFGYPITPEITEEDGHVVQYYQYARFEYWPNGDAEGNYVTIGELGRELRPLAIPRRMGPRPTNLDAQAYLPGGGGAAREAMLAARAWLQLDPAKVQPDGDDWRFFPETNHGITGGFKLFWEATGGEWYLGFPLTEEYVLGGTYYQIFERGQLAWEPGGDPYLMPLGELMAARYKLPTEPVGQGDIPTYSEDLFVPRMLPGPTTRGGGPLDPNAERWIEISIGQQYLIAWQGDVAVYETYVSTGRETFETPTGTFFVSSKIESEDMAGVIGGESYNVPDVPWTMYFTDRGHALHGTYWHSNFGTPMSHGCVNIPLDLAKAIYEWGRVGMRIEITA